MEIKFSHVSGLSLNNLSFVIPKGEIVGVYGKGGSDLLKLISLKEKSKGIIYYDKIRKLSRNYYLFKNEMMLVEKEFVNDFGLDNIYEYFVYYISYYKINVKNTDKKIKDAIKIVGLTEDILNRRFSSLTHSEMKFLQLALAFIYNPKVLLLDDILAGLDLVNKRKIIKIFWRLRDKFHKTIIIYSNDINLLYQFTSYMIVLSSSVYSGKSKDIFYKMDLGDENIPAIVYFNKLVEMKKKVKLPHREDVKDVIKDIYWNVRW